MFSTVFKYNLLITLRERNVLFWSLAFPLMLSLLFSMAFANLGSTSVIREAIPLAYVQGDKPSPMYDLKGILSSIPRGEAGTDKLFSLQVVKDEAQARQLVLDKAVAAAVLDGQTPHMMVNSVSINQVVVKQVLDQINYAKQTIASLARHNPLTLGQNILGQLNGANYVRPVDLGSERMQPDIIFYYALLAMTCLGACNAGAWIIQGQQANKSVVGARSTASPASKWLRVAAAGLASWLVQLLMSLLVLGFMALVLGKHFGDHVGYVVVLLAIGTLMGFLMGMAIACLMRGRQTAVSGVATGIYLLSSFLTGLMSVDVKRMVDTRLPWLSAINPGSMIVDSFYSLYYYRDVDYRFLISMLIACLAFMAVVAVTLGRRYHDSI